MSQHGVPSSVVSDPFRFAAEARSIEGKLAATNLLRLSDALVSTDRVLVWRLDGSMVEGAEGMEPRLRLRATGTFDLCCQRCLGGLEWSLRLDTLLKPVRVGQPIPEEELEDDELDALELEGELDVVALLEEEILLALPIAPRHQVCEAPRPKGGSSKESPFAALASLRGSPSAE